MCLSSRLSAVMGLFPYSLWRHLLVEPIFTKEEVYEIESYFHQNPINPLHPPQFAASSWLRFSPEVGCYDDMMYREFRARNTRVKESANPFSSIKHRHKSPAPTKPVPPVPVSLPSTPVVPPQSTAAPQCAPTAQPQRVQPERPAESA